MTSDQWVSLVSQIGIGGVALVGMAYLFVRVVVPMASARATELIMSFRELTAEIKQLRSDMTVEHNAIMAALGDIGSRISRIEGAINIEPNQPREPSNPGLATGSRDLHHIRQR